MAEINEVLTGDSAGLVGALKEAAGAADTLLEKLDQVSAKADAAFSGAAGGPAKLASAWDDAAAKVSLSVDKIARAQERLGTLGAAGATGPDRLVKAWDVAAGNISGSVDKIALSTDKLSSDSAAMAAAAEGPGKLAASWDTAAAQVEASAGRIADAQKGVADSQVASSAKAADAATAAAAAQSKAAKQAAADAEAANKKYSTLLLGGAAALGYGVYKAAQLQTQGTRLYTSAGESIGNVPMIEQGELKLSGQTNTSQAALAQGAYWTESANFHGKNALAVLKAAAEGAQAEGADMPTVSNALTTVLNDYFGGPQKSAKVQQQQAMQAMNMIISSVGQGKMTLQGEAAALPVMLPTAKTAGLQLPQVLGALATMTSQGASSEDAAQQIRHTITALQKPSNVQSAEMQMLGINPVQLSHDLGKQGLTGTLAEVGSAIQKHMGKDGLVLLDTMNQSKLAVQSANLEIAKMPPSIQGVAKAYLSGSIGVKQFNQEVRQGGESARSANLLKQFETTAGTALGFSAIIKAGQGNKQTQAAALNALMGGQVGQQVAQMTGGSHLKTFNEDVRTIGDTAKHTGDNIRGWNDVQKTLNFQIGSFTKTAEAVATEAGQTMLPAVTNIMKGLSAVGGFVASNPELTKMATVGGTVLGGSYLLGKVQAPAQVAVQMTGKIGQALGIPGADKLASAGQGTGAASGGLDKVAVAGNAAAEALGKVAAAGDRAATGETAAGTAGEREAIGETAAGTAGSKAALGEEALLGGKKGGGVTGAVGVATIALMVAQPIIDALENKHNDRQLGNTNPNSWWNNWDTDFKSSILGHVVSAVSHPSGPSSTTPVASGMQIGRFGPLFTPGLTLPAAQPTAGAAPGIPAALHGMRAPANVDTSAISSITSALSKPVKVAAPDLSGVEAAKAKAMSAADGINQAIETPLHRPVKATAPDLSAFSSARGAAQADGAAVSAGLAGGIEAGKAGVVAAAQDVAHAAAAAMASALKTHSPSKVTEVTGADTAAGVAVGLVKGKSKVKAASTALAASTVTSLTLGLQGGQSAIDAALTALTGKASRPQDQQQIDSTVSTLIGDLNTALKKGAISRSQDSALTAWLKADNAKLDALAGQRAKLEAEITNAGQVAQQAVSEASIMNAATATPPGSTPPQSAYGLISGMQYQAQAQQQFAAQMKQLQSLGLNATTLDQISQGGATAGLPITQGLLSGGKGDIAQVNQLESQILKSAGALGDVGGPAMYQAGQDLASQTAKGLKGQLGSVDSQMKAIAQQMTSVVSQAMSGNGSAAMKAAGTSAGQAFASGIASQAAAAAAAAGRLAQAAEAGARQALSGHPGVTPYRSGGYTGGGGGGGSQTVHLTANITVQLDGRQVGNAVQDHVLTVSANNWQNPLRYPGRAY